MLGSLRSSRAGTSCRRSGSPHPGRAGRVGAGPVPHAPGPALHRAQEQDSRHAHRLRAALPGLRPVRRGWPEAPPAHEHPGAVGRHAEGEPAAHRGSSTNGPPPASGTSIVLEPITLRSPAHDRPRHRLGPGLDHRLGDRRDLPVPLSEEAHQLHRTVSEGPAVRRERSSRPPFEERTPLPALGADRGCHPRRPSPRLRRALRAHQATARKAAGTERRPRRGGSQARRGHLVTCSRDLNRSLRQAPRTSPWSHDDPQVRWATGASSYPTLSSR